MTELLERMLVGAGRMMDSVEAWENELKGAPGADRFVEQLRAEWFTANAPDELSEHVAAQVKQHLSLWHPGWPHLWAHILRATGTMLALAPQAEVDPVVAYLTVMCHDVAKFDAMESNQSHEELGAAFVERVLDGHLGDKSMARMQDAILKRGDSDLMKLLHDADKLDKIGACGVLRRISTNTSEDWIPAAIQRVKADWADFPKMYFGDELADNKRRFLEWFLNSG
ncbi:MAG TPA: hypothetical protein VHP83_25990 [Aggregatilineaceae bacterium]|nr:hypothetical protein [Aggregatilineaceae bacterium]